MNLIKGRKAFFYFLILAWDKEAIKLMVDVVNSDYEKRAEADVLLKQWIK